MFRSRAAAACFVSTPLGRQHPARLIRQQVSSFVRTDTGVNSSPTLLKREAKTDLDAFGDEVVVIGGLVDTKQSASTTADPFLPSWFDSKRDDQAGSDLLVHLQVSRQQVRPLE